MTFNEEAFVSDYFKSWKVQKHYQKLQTVTTQRPLAPRNRARGRFYKLAFSSSIYNVGISIFQPNFILLSLPIPYPN